MLRIYPLVAVVSVALFPMNARLANAQTTIQINTDQQRIIGGISQLDRERFFTHTETVLPPTNTNLGNLRDLLGSPNGPNVVSGRISTEFDQGISFNFSTGQHLPEDPSRTGFINPNVLRNHIRTNYRNFVLTSNRYAGIRDNGNAFIVNSGRFGTFFPSYFYEPGTGGVPRADAYAEFLNIYLDEVIFGANAFYPVPSDRFAIELLNEPDLHFSAGFTRQDLADWHRDVIQAVKAVHPDAIIGGPSLALTSFESNEFNNNGTPNFSRFDERLGRTIADRSNSGIDFYSFHPYERYDVTFNNTLNRAVDNSPGRTSGLLDLTRARDLAENPGQSPLPIAITEYGSFNFLFGDPVAAGYTRAEMQWDLARDIREQLLIYLDRPDVILNATPFVQARHFSSDIPTPVNADNVFYEQNSSGQWSETIVAQTFRSYANVSGSYIGLTNNNSANVQSVAFRDGNEVYVLLNNLLETPQTVDLSVVTALGGIQSATRDRVFQQGEDNFFIDDFDITNSFQSIVLNPEEGSVITFTLENDQEFGSELIQETYYSNDTVLALNVSGGSSPQFVIDAAVDNRAVDATLRVSYDRPGSGSTFGEGFSVNVNGNVVTIPTGVVGIDDGDQGLQTREVDIPLEFLVDGANNLVVDFVGNGGFLASAALIVTSNSVQPGDFDADGDIDGSDFLAWQRGESPDPFSASDLSLWQSNYGNPSALEASSVAVPEPCSLLLAILIYTPAAALRRRPRLLSRRGLVL